jgi:adenine-specific DNA-methyltransferase
VIKESSFVDSNNVDDHHIHLGYAEELADTLEGDICYIDPPYIKRQYAANYHVLETLARGDEPEAVGVSGLRPWRDQYSNFCSKVKIRDSFDTIIKGLKCNDILISYSEDGLLSLDELMDFLSGYGQVSKKSILYKRFKSNDSRKSSVLEEYLVHLRKN